ncbi:MULTISPECIES: SPOR domain-containing protein [unclassified Sinorhizobium]|uniref:SPOR domain-containing protein n=1 Tax=unclassified Sinorhizobium TaxID=2613772 RepID=UPI0024C439DB|nr:MULTISPECIES: SPOR domain-containing protein [unclassified Sinorhizobium]MDK1376625.1 SPOR domain-containing protein [Sinorhizobium sp. 6-70]MDK1477097.1 SPOR domain-containing protein [Sinorhizobium sp. 6-117]MDK1477234.1 SPOR domain-containing protein [Sinorhizobium sp. 6-117]
MADKQFARSGPAEFDVLADDDPLSELARIVGYDARPAVQQLQELQRHQEAVRRDPAFDLEEELLREFDSYDAPRAVAVHPDSGLVEHPVAGGVAEQHHAEAPTPVEPVAEYAVAAVEDRASPLSEPAEDGHDDTASLAPAADAVTQDELDVVDVPELAEIDPAVDLERELELSLGYEDLSLPQDSQGSGASHASGGIELHSARNEALDAPAFEAMHVPLSLHAAAAARAGEPAASLDAVFVDMADELARHSAEIATPVVNAAVVPAAASSGSPDDVDQLLADVERFPVPVATGLVAAAVEAHPALHASPAAPATAAPVKKSSYPFKPTFSRATPVASASGASQQRAFAAPIAEPVVAKIPATPATLPVATPEPVQEVAAVEPEPSFDIDDFELELSELALDIDPPKADAEQAVHAAAEQPIVAHPALIEPAAQPFLQALSVPAEAEVRHDEPQASTEVIAEEEEPAESALPFDPAMIAEPESGVAPIADVDVPQLPALEVEEKPAAYATDYDLDIDAEMAQLFSTPGPRDGSRVEDHGAHAAAALPAAAKASPQASVADDFDEFEKAMEEDFQRSMAERQQATQDTERLAPKVDRASEYVEQGYGRRSQRTMLLAASVAGVIILGGAGVYAWMGGSTAALTGDGPKIILADKNPVKVVPEEKGGKTVPNQDKAVYDRVAGAQGDAPRQEALVSSTEEPMDVVQKTLTPETLPLEGSDDADAMTAPAEEEEVARLLPDGETSDAATAEEERAPAVAPRKVRTMIVKPDGTLVAREEPVVPPANDATASVNESIPATASGQAAAAGSKGEATVADAGSELRPSGQPPAGAEKAALAAPSDASIEEVAVRSVKTTAIGGQAAPVPQTRPKGQAASSASANVAKTPAENAPAIETANAAPAAPLATASVPAGSYVIQIASLPSEAEAQKSYNSLSAKFASVIGGRGVDIRKAEIAGKGTYYRVRIPAGSREEANALCSRYKGAGGSCLVTK